MADRLDPSQYGFTAGNPDGAAFLPDSTITTVQTQDAPDGVYADAADMAGYPDHANPQDPMSVRPRDYFTQAPTTARIVGNYRPISPFGGPVSPGTGLIAGFNLLETSGTTPAQVTIRDGNDPSAPVMLYIALGPGESTRDWYFPGGLKFRYGVYVQVVTGAIAGVLYTMETELV